ncbi:N-acetylmuramoyl-L-alanine amidase [Tissierella carlieri]|uniref:N-acetylmuramoyl-L-alanine amidase n=1 Tax=Tissierella carlieri TaxID=689904 RepID=A0ABT1SC88_9FIRM|nr:N-acetylmuramoyl-L-alanine amidase [Tissierella carlieri]MCQ4924102.1 N-acetylmuramoyl-L-alanine amidase [Tissierella carlieri]
MIDLTIDAGHGGKDSGAVGTTGVKEKDITLKLALKVGKILSSRGVSVNYTRTDDSSVELSQRAAIANNSKARFFLSIHINSASSPTANGTETYAFSAGGQGEKLAAAVQKNLVAAIGLTNRGVKFANFAVLRETAMPAALTEVNFICNPKEEAMLKDEAFLDKTATGISKGVVEFLGLKWEQQPQPTKPPETPKVEGITRIMGTAQATVSQMVSFAMKGNKEPQLPSCTLKELAEIFVSEAKAEGVRADVAWAQSLHETGYFKYGGIVKASQNNYAGIGALNGNAEGQAANFPTPIIGVRAQIQHLKAYASKEALVNECVDPRFSLVTRGSAEFVEWLGVADNPNGKGWAYLGRGYGASVISLLNGILKEEKEVEDGIPQWQKDALETLVEKKVIGDRAYWSKRLGEKITIGEVLGLLAKL